MVEDRRQNLNFRISKLEIGRVDLSAGPKKSPLTPPFSKGRKSPDSTKKSPFLKGGFREIFLLVVEGKSAGTETRPTVLINPAKPDD
jgi:hypothetical protein